MHHHSIHNQPKYPQKSDRSLTTCPIAYQATLNPTTIAVQTDTNTLTYIELHKRITYISLQLFKLNMKKGDRLVSISENNLSLLLLQFTCLRNGFIFCPLNPKFSAIEMQQRLTLLNSAFIWQPGDRNSLCLDFEANCDAPPLVDVHKIDPKTIINIIFTSGSSGDPKAVMHHFSNHYYSALGSQRVIPLSSADNNLLSLPIFHISGYATVIRTILAGATLHISAVKITVAQLKIRNITHLSLVMSQLQTLLLSNQFQQSSLSIKHLLLGGSAFPKNILIKTRQRGFTYHLSYGSTEMASQIATSTNNQDLQLLPYRQLKIIDNEIQVSGKTRFAGYFNGNSQSGLIDATYYFSSSDIGEFNAQTNTIKIMGRKDRQFISGGENIQPEEIEKILLTFPQLSQAYVLPIDDAEYGQRPIAFIKWHNSDQSDQLRIFIKDKLLSFKHPLHYFKLPTQQGLKINIKQLTALAHEFVRKKE
ncbi:MAG: AMP-binding protein [Psychromonas sp.]